MPDDPAKPPRFPFVAALLCAGCVGAAGWTWMRYSYAWHLTPAGLGALKRHYEGRLWTFGSAAHGSWPVDSFVRVRAQQRGTAPPGAPQLLVDAVAGGIDNLYAISNSESWQILPQLGSSPAVDMSLGGRRWLYGRLVPGESVFNKPFAPLLGDAPLNTPVVDMRRGRLHGASVAGLVVGTMGVFVFTVALRHWRNQRKTLHVETAEAVE